MKFSILSLFPQIIEAYISESILKIAQEKAYIEVETFNFRDFSSNKHKKVDEIIYGGGSGMLLAPQPLYDTLEEVFQKNSIEFDLKNLLVKKSSHPQNRDYELIVTSPSGQRFEQSLAKELSQKKHLIILAGRYEGFDQRIRDLASMEISVGDYVLTGGELPALSIMDAVSRLIPGVLGDDSSSEEESFSELDYFSKLKELGATKKEIQELIESTGLESSEALKKLKLLEYPQYTRPRDFYGSKVPEILESGNHKKIFLWRLKEAIKLTKSKRKDLKNY
jgi:tRNA (guanine37-N1)-methyltransferase